MRLGAECSPVGPTQGPWTTRVKKQNYQAKISWVCKKKDKYSITKMTKRYFKKMKNLPCGVVELL